MKRYLYLVLLVFTSSTYADCFDAVTPDNNEAFLLTNASVERIGSRGTMITTLITSNKCSHEFYFENSNKDMLSMLLSAKITGAKVTAYFMADGNSPDFNWGDIIATHLLTGLDLYINTIMRLKGLKPGSELTSLIKLTI